MTDRDHKTTVLRILATSDLHMHLMSHDYFEDRACPHTGLQALSGRIRTLRREVEQTSGHCILVDNGDLLQGTPLGDSLAKNHDLTAPHPVAQMMDAMGYDALGVGNHDLDYGLPYLQSFARSLAAPMLCSNLHLAQDGDWLRPWVLRDIGPLRLGILSVLPERTMTWAHASLDGQATISDMRDTIRRTAAKLREDGADVVIALAHTGLNTGTGAAENKLEQIAADGAVDALVGGHTHVRFPVAKGAACPDHLHDVPTVMPGYGGEALGCIDLHLIRASDGAWRVRSSTARLETPDHSSPPPREMATLAPAHTATRTALNELVGSTDKPLTSYFAQLQPTPMLALVAAAKQQAIDRARQGTAYATLPLLSSVSPERAGGKAGPANYADIPAGPLKLRQIAQFHVFPNAIWAVPVTGEELRNWLEKSAAAFSAPHALDMAGLLSPLVPAFDFDVIYGVTYTIDPTVPARFDADGVCVNPTSARIGELRYQGTLVRDSDRFLIATNNYRACGGGHFPSLTPERDMLRADLPSARVMRDYVGQGTSPDFDPPWALSPNASGVQTWFKTGPKARAHLSDIAAFAPQTPVETQDGFLRIPITLPPLHTGLKTPK